MKGVKFFILVVMISLLAGCCRTPQECYPASKGSQYSVMGFIMGGGLIGHAIRKSNGGKFPESNWSKGKKNKKAIEHFNKYHNEMNMQKI